MAVRFPFLLIVCSGLGLVTGLADQVSAQTASNLVCTQCVQNGDLDFNAVSRDRIRNAAIDATKLSANAVNSLKIATGAVTAAKIGPGAVNVTKLANSSVSTEKLQVGAVNTSRLRDGAVTLEKLSESAVAQGRSVVSDCQDITEPGSYLVVTNLPGPAGLQAGGSCLELHSDNITLDLGGFQLLGDGNGPGVTDNGAARQGLSVTNGTIDGFSVGVALTASTDCVVADLRVLDNAGVGVDSGTGCRVSDNVVAGNGGRNIQTGEGNLVARNVVTDGTGDGILAGRGSIVVENIVSDNGGDGVVLRQGTLLTSNAITQNTLRGVDSNEAAEANKIDSGVTNNVVVDNGGSGIHYATADDGLLVGNNVIRSNTGGNQEGTCTNCAIISGHNRF